MWIETETTIKGGLPVIVRAHYYRASESLHYPGEYPGCDEIEDMVILWPSGHEVKFEICPEDWDAAAEDLWEKIRRGRE